MHCYNSCLTTEGVTSDGSITRNIASARWSGSQLLRPTMNHAGIPYAPATGYLRRPLVTALCTLVRTTSDGAVVGKLQVGIWLDCHDKEDNPE